MKKNNYGKCFIHQYAYILFVIYLLVNYWDLESSMIIFIFFYRRAKVKVSLTRTASMVYQWWYQNRYSHLSI